MNTSNQTNANGERLAKYLSNQHNISRRAAYIFEGRLLEELSLQERDLVKELEKGGYILPCEYGFVGRSNPRAGFSE